MKKVIDILAMDMGQPHWLDPRVRYAHKIAAIREQHRTKHLTGQKLKRLLLRKLSLLKTFNPDQERDEHGRWTDDLTKPPFPMSKDVDAPHRIVEQQIRDGVKPKVVTIPTKDFRALRATQDELKPPDLDDAERAGPLFKDYADKPVVLDGNDGNYHVLDGHNRISAAVRANRDVKVYLFRESNNANR